MSTCTSRSLVTLHALVAVCILFTCGRPSVAGVVYVKATAPGSVHDGTSWATAFTIVQQGIDAAVAGDEVWVAASTYQENISLKSGVGLFGGFAGTETGRSQRNPSANVTTLDGQYKATVVTIAADATTDTVVDGFTILNGYGPVVDGSGRAGGVFIQGGTPIVSNNVITGCYAASGGRTITSRGGGIYVAAGTPLIAGNTITNNHAMFGGGIYANGGLIRDNVIAYNWASHPYLVYGAGGGLRVFGAVVVHNLIQGNAAPDPYGGGGGMDGMGGIIMDNVFRDNVGQRGAALYCYFISTVIRNTFIDSLNSYQSSEVDFGGGTFSNNLIIMRSDGSGIVLGYSSIGNSGGTEPVISNNTIIRIGPQTYENNAVWSDYYNGEKPVFSNNIVMGWQTAGRTFNRGTPPVFTTDHNDLYGNGDNTLTLPGASPIGMNGNISQDPLFVDAANGDYRLQAGSPCIDAGNDEYVTTGDRDAEGRPRIAGAHVDIGAYEYGSPLYTMLD